VDDHFGGQQQRHHDEEADVRFDIREEGYVEAPLSKLPSCAESTSSGSQVINTNTMMRRPIRVIASPDKRARNSSWNKGPPWTSEKS
jgi:hypothetical protein